MRATADLQVYTCISWDSATRHLGLRAVEPYTALVSRDPSFLFRVSREFGHTFLVDLELGAATLEIASECMESRQGMLPREAETLVLPPDLMEAIHRGVVVYLK